MATPKLRRLLAALLLLVQGGTSASGSPGGSRPGTPSPLGVGAALGSIGGSSSNNKVSAMVEMDRCLKLQALVVEARQCLAPFLRGGDRACQGRWGLTGD